MYCRNYKFYWHTTTINGKYVVSSWNCQTNWIWFSLICFWQLNEIFFLPPLRCKPIQLFSSNFVCRFVEGLRKNGTHRTLFFVLTTIFLSGHIFCQEPQTGVFYKKNWNELDIIILFQYVPQNLHQINYLLTKWIFGKHPTNR